MKMTIVTNGRIENLSWLRKKLDNSRAAGDFIICADGASRYLQSVERVPDLLIGDFDSIDPEAEAWMEKHEVPKKRFPAKKDQTDTEIALSFGLTKKPSGLDVLGAFGNRMDHTLGNIQLLERFYDPKIPIRLMDGENEVWMLDRETVIEGRKGENLSLIPVTETVEKLTVTGVEYPLENHSLIRGTTLGISNVITKEQARVVYQQGKLLAVIARD